MARGGAARLRAEQAIEAGLGLYSQGDLAGALKRWRQALEIDPDNRRAREYVAYVEEHYDVLSRKLRGEGAGGLPDGEEPGPTIEMEADDPMEEIDAYDSVEVSMDDAEVSRGEEPDAASSPTVEMKPHKLVVQPHTLDDDDEDEGDITGEEATKAEGLAGRRRKAARSSGPETAKAVARPLIITEESIDEGWSLDELDAVPGSREAPDTLEIAAQLGILDDLSDLGTRADTHDPYAADRRLAAAEDETASGIARPSDDSTGEVTRPERFARPDSVRQRNTERSTPPPMPESHRVTPLETPPRSQKPEPQPEPRSEARAEFDLADFDDPEAPALGPSLGAVITTRPATPAEEGSEVRVTFRSPRDSEAPRTGSPPPSGPSPAAPPAVEGDDESTVDRLRPPLTPLSTISFDDETYERPSLSMLAAAAGDLDSLDGDAAESDDLALERRPGSEGDTGHGDVSERETTQLYRRDRRLSKGAVSMELIAAELEADLDESVTIDPGQGEDAVKARVGWLINRARSENQAGHFPVAVVAIDLALEQHPDSAVAQKLIHSNREVLNEVYRSFLGDLRAVPSLAMAMDKIPMHELDHRAAFLLSRIDGVLTLEDVLDVCGMARMEAFRHLSRLLLRGILELRA